jgi:outer membrane lipoprotein
MRIIPSILLLGLLLFGVSGCAVVSPEVQEEALPNIPLPVLIGEVQKYMGDTVIEGGYVVSVENKADYTEIVAVQSPLGIGQRPKAKDLSQGRLVMIYKGFIDPEVYAKDREITVGGKIIGSSAQVKNPAFPYLKLEIREIHLWAKEVPTDPYWYDPYWYGPYPFYDPYPWWWHRYPYHRRWHR